jgi:glucose-6-phosphate isomerase
METPMHGRIVNPSQHLDEHTGLRPGPGVVVSQRTIGELSGLFADEAARTALPSDRLAYRVVAHLPVPEGKEGGLFFGASHVEPGLVGDEYFMTKGHLHAKLDTGEYYWGLRGEGMLILMDEQRRCWAERVFPGSLHYIPGKVAHRLANTGSTTLSVGACWLADAGHDYSTIARHGFSARLRRIDGVPRLVTEGNPG